MNLLQAASLSTRWESYFFVPGRLRFLRRSISQQHTLRRKRYLKRNSQGN
jgi:hypothetical protein